MGDARHRSEGGTALLLVVGPIVSGRLRITVNTLSVTNANEGIRTMLTHLVRALVDVDRTNTYRLVCSKANVGLFAEIDGVERFVLPPRRRRPLGRIWHDQVTVPLLTRRSTDVLITPSSVGSLLAVVPEIVIVAAHLSIPSVRRGLPEPTLSPSHRLYYGPVMRWSHRRAACVAPISMWLAERLVAETGIEAGRVTPLPCGVSVSTHAPGRTDSVVPTVLFVSTLYPYKNADRLVQAFARAAPSLPSGARLVIVGRDPDGRQHPRLAGLAESLGVGNRVELTGKIGDDELEERYRQAAVLVYPSLAEGFGLPVLEAMARGVPVIAADRTSLPEVVGDAGLLVDPESTAGIGNAIVRVLIEPGLANRLSGAGRARAETMTWDRTAATLLDMIEHAGRRAARSSAADSGQ